MAGPVVATEVAEERDVTDVTKDEALSLLLLLYALVVQDAIAFRLKPSLSNEELNALFSTGWPVWQAAPDTSDWQPVLARSLAYFGAFAGDTLVGFVNVAWDGRDHAFLLDPRVGPEYRHRGIGSELVRLAAQASREAGCEWLHVDYEPDLARFYDACGFRHTEAGLMSLL